MTLFRTLVIREFRMSFPSRWSYAHFFFSTFSMIFILWYTSKSFVPNFEYLGKKVNYFEFVLSGEIYLLLPLVTISSLTRICRSLIYEKGLDLIILSPKSVAQALTHFFTAALSIELIRLSILYFSVSLFLPNLFLSPKAVSAFLLYLFALPCFLGFGFIACSVLIRFGRGQNVINSALSFLAILGGLYFPTTVLPEAVHQFLSHSSPFNLLLSISRQIIFLSIDLKQLIYPLTTLLIWNVLIFPISLFTLKKSVEAYRKKGAQVYLYQ